MATSSPVSDNERQPGTLTSGQTRAAGILFYSGWSITLLYFPSGLLHAVLGGGVYFRDILMVLHLGASIYWLVGTRKFPSFLRRSWLLVVPAIFLLPALGNDTYRVEALIFTKWAPLWLDWMALGWLALVAIPSAKAGVPVLGLITALLLFADLGAGLYERMSHNYVLSEKGEVSAFGVREDMESKLGKQLRVKGLQRDVFSFANIMAMTAVAGFLGFVHSKDGRLKGASLAMTGSFGLAMLLSGGRSAFFGVFASALIAGGLLLAEKGFRRNYGRIVTGWLVIGLVISFTGVGRLAETVGSSVMSSGSSIGNPGSAHDRDANWAGIVNALEGTPVLLVMGGPLGTLTDPKIDAMYHWADNQYLWLLYHTGFIGFLAILLFFAQILRIPPPEEQLWLRDGLIIFLVFVMGEAIARESLTFIGCLPLFVTCGALCGLAEQSADDTSQRRSRRPRGEVKIRSDASEFARQIRRAQRKEQ